MGVPFSQMPDDLINDPDMTLSALRAWHVIYVETLGRPGWDMSYGQIAERIGTKRRATAVDAIDLLLRKGWLIRMRQKSQQGDDAPNLFSVCREPHVPWNERQTVQGGTPDRTRGGTPDRTHQKNHLPGEKEHVFEGKTAQFSLQQPLVTEPVADLFDTFWSEYPRDGRVESKKQTRDAWDAAVKKDSPTVIIAALRRQLPYMRQQVRGGSNYNKHAKRWLSSELWREETPTEPLEEGGSTDPKGTKMPEGFTPDAAMMEWTRKHCPDIDPRQQFAKFANHCEAKGITNVSWPAAWKNWQITAQQWAVEAMKPDSLKPAHRSYRDKDGRTYE